MLPMKPVRKQLGELLGADATTLAPAANANKIALIKAAFVPEENMVPANVTLADFDGSDPLLAAVGAQQVGIDPATGAQIITIKEPAGGWRWETTGLTNLPQTIYGYGLFSNDMATLLGLALLPAPVQLSEVGQEINLGVVKMTMVDEPLS